MAAKLKTKYEFFLSGSLASVLKRTATEQGRTVDALVADALRGFLRMVGESGAVPEKWRAVPIDDDTEAVLAEYATDLDDDQTGSLMRAVVLYFDRVAENKRRTGSY